MTVYKIIEIMTGLFESIVAFMLFNNYMERRKNFPVFIYGIGVIGLTVSISISNILFNYSYWNVLCIVLLMTFSTYLYKSDFKTRLFLAILSVIISACAEMVILLILSTIRGVNQDDIYLNPNLRVLGIILSKALNLAIIKSLCIIKGKQSLKMKTSYWILFTAIFIVVLFTIYLIFDLQESGKTSDMSVFCSIGLLCSVFAALYLYEHMSKQAVQLKENELLEQQFGEQVKHLNELVFAQEQIKSVKHDLSNHMISLKSYLDEGHYVEGIEYLNKLINTADLNGEVIDTGNTVIDAIISAKKSLAKEKNIRFYVHMQIPEKINIDSSDCCVIFGNALDNAIEACDRLSRDRYIKLFLSYHDTALSCKIINSAPDTVNPLLKTTKSDKNNHGIGLTNIKNTLSKYKNTYRIEQENGEFIFAFILYDIH